MERTIEERPQQNDDECNDNDNYGSGKAKNKIIYGIWWRLNIRNLIVTLESITFVVVFFFDFKVLAVITVETLRTETSRWIFSVVDLAHALTIVDTEGKVGLAHSWLTVLGTNIRR